MREPNDRSLSKYLGIAVLATALGVAACGASQARQEVPAPEELAREDSLEAARRAEEERRRLEEQRRLEEERRRAEEEARRAAEEAQEQPAGREHIVRRGDTLWDLAGFYLSNPFLWPMIYEANRDVVEDPHWIYPNERLVIPGLPPLRAEAPADVTAVKAAEGQATGVKASEGRATGVQATEPRRTRFYRAPGADPSATQGDPTIEGEYRRDLEVPQVRPGEFYAAPWLSRSNELRPVARVVSIERRDAAVGRAPETANRYGTVYLRPTRSARLAAGDRLTLVRIGHEVGGYGRVVEPVGQAVVTELHEETAAAVVMEHYGLLEEGTYAVPFEEFPGLVEEPARPVESGPEGRLIGFDSDQLVPAPRDHVFIDLGRAAGIEVGDEFIVILPERGAPRGGADLPEETVARLRVVKVTERTATAQILRLEQAALRLGLPVRLVAKRP